MSTNNMGWRAEDTLLQGENGKNNEPVSLHNRNKLFFSEPNCVSII
jgi:hypothetical protein